MASWAAGRPDVLGAALAGGSAVILLTDDVTTYTQHAAWAEELGAARIVRTQQWGPLTERRLGFPSGLELDVWIGEPAWASIVPLDPGTVHVVEDGFRILHDPHGLLEALVAAVETRA